MDDYLFWSALTVMLIFVGLRLWWIYRRGTGQLRWRTAQAPHLYAAAVTILVALLAAIFFTADYRLLLAAIPAIYILLSFTAVKVNESGIMANAVMARWQDIVRLHYNEKGGYFTITTRHPWQWIKLRVPPDKFHEFRKMLAAKGLALSDRQHSEEAFA